MAIMCLCSLAFARVDNRTYTSNVDTTAVWINPQEIKVYIEDSSKKYIFEKAFTTWDKALRENLNFVFVKNKQDADITIAYTEKLEKSQVGLAETSYITIQGKKYLHKVGILISKTDFRGFVETDAELYKTTLHEIGHAIGIIGHSNNARDIMYPTRFDPTFAFPSKRDIETVEKIYGF